MEGSTHSYVGQDGLYSPGQPSPGNGLAYSKSGKAVRWAALPSDTPEAVSTPARDHTEPQQHTHESLLMLSEIVSSASRGPKYRPAHGEFIKPGDRGLAGLLNRYVFVGQHKWDRYMSLMKAGKRDRPRRSVLFGLPVLHPSSPYAKAWMGFMLAVDLVYTAFIVPVNVAFCTTHYGSSIDSNCTQVDLVGGIIYFINILVMLVLGMYMARGNLQIRVMDGLDVAHYYFRSWRFVLDIVAVIPFFYLIVVLSLSIDKSSALSWIHLLSLVRLARMTRMLSISKMVTLDLASGQYKKLPLVGGLLTVSFMYTALLVYLLIMVVNLQACILVLEANLQPDTAQTFYESVTFVDAWQEPGAYRWYFAIYWVITTATGTGFGDVSPKNITEQVLANINMILGVLMFGLLVGTVSNALTRASAAAAKLYSHRKKVTEVDSWLQQRDIRKGLKAEIQAYFLQFWKGRNGSSPEQAILSDLPAHLRDCALSHIMEPLVAQVHGLQVMPPQLQSLLSGCFRAVTLLPGQDFCVQGRDADRCWIVESGGVIVLQYQDQSSEELDMMVASGRLSRSKLARSSRIASLSQPALLMRELDADEPTDNRYSPVFVPLTTPCLIGESVMLADDIPTCRQRLVTYRAIQQCVAWELRVSDLWPLMHMYPQIKVVMLNYLRDRLCRELVHARCDPDNHYCELAVVIAGELSKPGTDPAKLDDLVTELQKADIENGELSSILATLAEVCCIQPWDLRPAGDSNLLVPDSERVPPMSSPQPDPSAPAPRPWDSSTDTASQQAPSMWPTAGMATEDGSLYAPRVASPTGRPVEPIRHRAQSVAAIDIIGASLPRLQTTGSVPSQTSPTFSPRMNGLRTQSMFVSDGGGLSADSPRGLGLGRAVSSPRAGLLSPHSDNGAPIEALSITIHEGEAPIGNVTTAVTLPSPRRQPAQSPTGARGSLASIRQLSRFVRDAVVLEDVAEGESESIPSRSNVSTPRLGKARRGSNVESDEFARSKSLTDLSQISRGKSLPAPGSPQQGAEQLSAVGSPFARGVEAHPQQQDQAQERQGIFATGIPQQLGNSSNTHASPPPPLQPAGSISPTQSLVSHAADASFTGMEHPALPASLVPVAQHIPSVAFPSQPASQPAAPTVGGPGLTPCAVCGHAICPTCAHMASHPTGVTAADGSIGGGSSVSGLSSGLAHLRQDARLSSTPNLATGSAPSRTQQAQPRTSPATARVISGFRPPNVRRARPSTSWRRQLAAGNSLDRTSNRLGTTSIDRYARINTVSRMSIPMQAGAMEDEE